MYLSASLWLLGPAPPPCAVRLFVNGPSVCTCRNQLLWLLQVFMTFFFCVQQGFLTSASNQIFSYNIHVCPLVPSRVLNWTRLLNRHPYHVGICVLFINAIWIGSCCREAGCFVSWQSSASGTLSGRSAWAFLPFQPEIALSVYRFLHGLFKSHQKNPQAQKTLVV